MPIDAFGGNSDFRQQVRPAERDTRSSRAAQRDAADHPVFRRNLLVIQEFAKLLGLKIGRNSRRQSHSKALCARPLDAFAGARPSAGPAMQVVAVWRSTV